MEVQSQFIEMVGDPRSNPKGWKIKKLPDIASYSIGLTYKPEQLCEDGTIVLRSGNIQEGEIDLQDLVRVNAPIRDNLWVKEGDILMCSRNGSASLVGKVAQIKSIVEPMTYGAFMTIIRSEYSDYLYMYFQSGDFRDQISSGKSSTMNQITQKMLDKIEIPIPNQEVISTLSAILHQSDKSKFVGFKSQFIEMFKNLPVNGVIKDLTVGNIASVKKSYSKEDIINYIDISSIDNTTKTIVETSEHLVTKAPSRAQQCVQKGDILVSTVRPINRNIAVIEEDTSHLVASTGFCILRPQEGYKEYLLLIVLSDTYTEKMCDKANGGLYPAVNNSDVLNYGIHIPDEDTAKKVSALYQQSDKSKLLHRKSIKYSKYSL